jgi:hypothetical protein
MNIQENRIKNNCNKRKKLRILVLSPNVNDYDTGEFPYPINNDNNRSDNKPDRMSFTNNLSHRFAYDQNKGVIFDFSQESDDDVEDVEEADDGEKNNNEYY